MTSLRYLDCDTNFLTGTIPSDLEGMRSLETLWLNNNLLTGTIPTELGLMTNLKNLYLSNNFLTGTMPSEICALNIGNLEVNCDKVHCDCCSNCNRGTQAPSTDPILTMLLLVAPDGGQALRDASSPQYRAYEWLKSPLNSAYGTEQRLIQRYALATLYISTSGDSWDTNYLWLTSASECLWYSTSTSTSICDSEDNYLELDLRNNSLRGNIPHEVVLLSDTLGKL